MFLKIPILTIFVLLLVQIHINLANFLSPDKSLDNFSKLKKLLLKNRIENNSLASSEKEFLSKILLPFYFENSLKTSLPKSISPQCSTHLTQWTEELVKFILNPLRNDTESWALHMIDSWGKIPEGILNGHTMNLGDFDECVEINVNSFVGQYCSIYFIPSILTEAKGLGNSRKAISPAELLSLMIDIESYPLLLPQTSICLPSTCNDEDIAIYSQYIFKPIEFLLVPSPYICIKGGEKDLDTGAIVMICILSVLGGICIFGTAFDLTLKHYEQKKISKLELSNSVNNDVSPVSKPKYGLGTQLILAFSVYTNTKRWLNTSTGSDNLGCIHGIRFLSMCWVVLGHTWVMIYQASIWNLIDIRKSYEANWTMNTVFNGTVSVDTFFTLSGLLVCYNLLKVLDKTKGQFNIPMFYIHRYLRLTPMYALIVGFMATILPYLGNGPQRYVLDFGAEYCKKNWWHNLLYINNLIKYGEDTAMCEGETWYISNDMQFYIISPLFIYPLWKWKKIGMGVLSLGTIGAILTPAIITYEYNLPPTNLPHGLGTEYMKKIYIKPWTRIGPYLIGIWTGFLIYHFRNRKLELKSIHYLTGWTISTGIALSVLYGPWKFNDPKYEISKWESAIYSGVHRTAWGISIGWIIFACIKGYGGLVNKFLSWKVFMPLGRLTFAVYLVSYQIQSILTAVRGKHSQNYDIFIWTTYFFSEMILSLLIGFICTITMESPFMQLEKILLSKFN